MLGGAIRPEPRCPNDSAPRPSLWSCRRRRRFLWHQIHSSNASSAATLTVTTINRYASTGGSTKPGKQHTIFRSVTDRRFQNLQGHKMPFVWVWRRFIFIYSKTTCVYNVFQSCKPNTSPNDNCSIQSRVSSETS